MFSKILSLAGLAAATASWSSEVTGKFSEEALHYAIECEGCEKFVGAGINKLIGALEGGIPASCAALCSKAFTNQIEGEVCLGLCTLGGLYEFINLIETADLSPVWMCIELHACPQTTCTSNCATVTNIEISPTSVTPPQVIKVDYDITFAEGVGVATTMGGFFYGPPGVNQTTWGTDGMSQIISPTAGTPYHVSLSSHTEVSEGQGMNFCMDKGTYNSTVTVCEGQCGDDFKKSGPVIGQGSGPTVEVHTGSANCQPALRN